jgi:hypothetical protein
MFYSGNISAYIPFHEDSRNGPMSSLGCPVLQKITVGFFLAIILAIIGF